MNPLLVLVLNSELLVPNVFSVVALGALVVELMLKVKFAFVVAVVVGNENEGIVVLEVPKTKPLGIEELVVELKVELGVSEDVVTNAFPTSDANGLLVPDDENENIFFGAFLSLLN